MRPVLILLLVMVIACRSSVTTSEKMNVILSYTADQKNPLNDTTARKAGDVEVFRVIGEDTAYYTRMYRIQDNEVRRYEATIIDHVLYNKSSWKWLNDSTVAFHLLDETNGKSYRFQLTGSGPTTTVVED
ncbi:MAG TPA: hypothetical protein VF145_10235 [Chitinophagaceae bacterium]